MTKLRPVIPLPHRPWVEKLFSARTVRYGGVVRRKIRWIEAEVGRDIFIEEVRGRGWHLVECNGHFVVFCTPKPVQLHF